MPVQGSTRIVADNVIWDQAQSNTVIGDGRYTLIRRVKNIDPSVVEARMTLIVSGDMFYRWEMYFGDDLLKEWTSPDGDIGTVNVVFEAMTEAGNLEVDFDIPKYSISECSKLGIQKAKGTFFVRVYSRNEGTFDYPIGKTQWDCLYKTKYVDGKNVDDIKSCDLKYYSVLY